jgi:hypothetical protein
MKFLNSDYGKVIMFLIGVVIAVASFGTAAPAVIAINSVLFGFQAAELIMGKSMGELITSGMEDGSATMALQMAIDIGLMVSSVAAGGRGSGATKGLEGGVEAMVRLSGSEVKSEIMPEVK